MLVGPQGRSDRFTRNPDGSYTPPPGLYTTLAGTAAGGFTATHPDQTTWSFDPSGRLSQITDRYGNHADLSYDGSGRPTAIGDPAGRGALTLSYDGAGRVTNVVDWGGRTVGFTYDGTGRLSSVTDRNGQTTTHGYDGGGRLQTITDAKGHVVVTNTYDGQGRVTLQQDATGQQTSFTYQTTPVLMTTVTYPATSVDPTYQPTVEDWYDAQGRVTKRVARPSRTQLVTTAYTYDSQSNLAAVEDANGRITKFCYDRDYLGAPSSPARGLLTRRFDPPLVDNPTPYLTDPAVTLYQYDGRGNLTEVLPPRGVDGRNMTLGMECGAAFSTSYGQHLDPSYATDFTYDGLNQLTSMTQRFTEPDVGLRTATTTFTYEPSNPGLVASVTSPSSHVTTLGYGTGSQAGLLTSVTDPLGNRTSFTYDTAGRLTSLVDPNGNVSGATPADHTWQYRYDNEDRLTATTAPPVSGVQATTRFGYDAVGNRTVITDALGQITAYDYDARDSLLRVRESPTPWTTLGNPPPEVITTEYDYDNHGNLRQVLRAKDAAEARATDYEYDGLGRLVREIQHRDWPPTMNQLITRYGYDANSNLTSLTDPRGKTTSFGYDRLNRLTSITYGDPTTRDVAFAYDLNGNRTVMTETLGGTTAVTAYGYDEQDRLLSSTNRWNQVVRYRYDLDGQQTKVSYPDDTAVTYGYDAAGKLASLTDWANRATSYAYTAAGQLQTVTSFNGTTAAYSYDNAQRLTQVLHRKGAQALVQFDYGLDLLGNRTTATDNTGTTGYGYDRLSRLTGVTNPDGASTAYTYDRVGNRLSKAKAGTTTTYAYDKTDHLTAAGGIAYTFDSNGNLTSRGSTVFGYDQANRLITVTVGTNTTRYVHDGDGNLLTDTYCECERDQYVYDVNSSLPVLLDDGDRKYVWGLGLAYEVSSGGSVLVPHADGLGSVRLLSDVAGNGLQEYRTDEFGVPTLRVGPSAQPFQYTGERWDRETGLLYLRARYYDPSTGRFMTRDPFAGFAGALQSLNRYAYAENNPVNLTDPDGECPMCIPLAIIAVKAGLTAWDAIQTAETFTDPNASLKEKLLAGGLFVVGVATVGGGVSFGVKGVLRAKRIRDLTRAAELRYPSKAGRTELHHSTPVFLGGDPDGPRIRINAAYHQSITNKFRELWPYAQLGRTGRPNPSELHRIMDEAYRELPLRWYRNYP